MRGKTCATLLQYDLLSAIQTTHCAVSCAVAILTAVAVVVLTAAAGVSHMRKEYAPKHVRVRI